MPLVLAVSVFLCCIIGILSRPAGLLASIWPANAVMLGLLIRLPAARRPAGWIGAGIAFLAADLLTGGSLLSTLLLNGANVIGVAAGFLVYKALPPRAMRLQEPAAMLYLLLAATSGAIAAGLAGAIINPILFDGKSLTGFSFWFTTELVNYIAILPVILAFPDRGGWAKITNALSSWQSPRTFGPLLALVVSCIGSVVVGGAGAIAFPVPALLWCGLTYPIFATVVLTLLFGWWTLMAMGTGLLPTPTNVADELAMASARLGISLVAIAPIMLASVMESRNCLMERMRQLASQDPLTGILNRRAFEERAPQLMAKPATVAVLMIDLDHFKKINDKFGHAAGDEVLVAAVSRVAGCLRTGDLLGRLGGEEFAVVIPSRSEADVLAIADRIRGTIADTPIVLADGRSLAVTASIGLQIIAGPVVEAATGRVFANADSALYVAKKSGRNRVERFAATA